MARKDYELLASHLVDRRNRLIDEADVEFRQSREIVTRRMIGAVAEALASDNPRFDRDRFLKACGVLS